jgi:DNA-binding CsgD family transcriptional regulator
MTAQTAEVTAELAIARGRPDAAREAVLAGLARPSEDARYLSQLVATGIAAEAARPQRDETVLARARELMQRLDGIETQQLANLGVAETATARAELSRLTTPDPALWGEAAAAWEARPAPYQVAYSRWQQAEALLATGASRSAAAEPLRAAARIAREYGALGILHEVERLAARARIGLAEAAKPAPEADPDPHGLTPREREILAHLAAGHTNRQIADALFISPRTAGVHVSRILAKLGASTRGEAAATGRLAGLIDDAELERLLRAAG